MRPTSGGARSPRKTQSFLILECIPSREKARVVEKRGLGTMGGVGIQVKKGPGTGTTAAEDRV